MVKVNGSDITTGIFKKDDTILGDQSNVTKEMSLNATPVDAVNTDKLFAFDGSTNEGKVVTPTLDMLSSQTGTLTNSDTILGVQGGVKKNLSYATTPVNGVATDKLFGFDGTTNEAKLITPKSAMIDDIVDRNVTISSNDTTPSHLEDKLLVGSGLSLSTQNDGGNETRTIDLNIESSGTWTPVITNVTLGSTVPIATVERSNYKTNGKFCQINCLLNMGISPAGDEVRMTLPFDADDLQIIGNSWFTIDNTDPTRDTVTEIDAFLTTAGVPQLVTNYGNSIVKDGYLYFKKPDFSSESSINVDDLWLYITATYTTT